jgi:hypothetical protein
MTTARAFRGFRFPAEVILWAVARADATMKASLKGKRKYAGWDDAFMAALIAG